LEVQVPSVAAEQSKAEGLLERVEALEKVAATFERDDPRRKTLLDAVADQLRDAPPVRPVIAAEILNLTEKTVRAWAHEGVLTVASTKPRLLLDAERLHAIGRLVQDLRRTGKQRGLLDEVWARLSDEALLDQADLAESLGQMRRGEVGRVVHPTPGQ
jgi:tRNA A37 N6-isopentenylltransferase MiaA